MNIRTKVAVSVVVILGSLTLYFNQNAPLHTKRIVAVEVIIISAGVMLGGRAVDQEAMYGGLSESERLSIGDTISDFPVQDMEGEVRAFSELRGSITLVAFVQSPSHSLPWLDPNLLTLGAKCHDKHVTTIQISEPLDMCFPEGACTTAYNLPDLDMMTLCDPARTAWKACREPRYDVAILINASGEVVEMARLDDVATIHSKLI